MSLKILIKGCLLCSLAGLGSYAYGIGIHNLSGLMQLVMLIALSYGIGSFPTGYLLARIFTGHDVRTMGSGGIGATNVLRTGSKALALFTLLFDGLKGSLAVLLPSFLVNPEAHWGLPFITGTAAIIAHIHPVWLDFKGGKGVATGLGIMLALSWPIALCAVALWLATAFCTKYSSLSSLVAVLISPLLALYQGNRPLAGFLWSIGALIIWYHRSNIRRLIHGQEPKIGQKAP